MTDTSTVGFRPMARTVIMLGSELIADEVTAVLELVKNAYDADATKVTVDIDTRKDLIIITDNGFGMSRADILTKWLAPGTPSKAAVGAGDKPKTPSGRVTLGEKGIGRFAVHHLGAHLELISKKFDSDEESVLKVDWSEYENPHRYLDEVKNPLWQRISVTVQGSGTILRVSGLKSPWPAETISKLRFVLALLMDQNDSGSDPLSFRVELLFDGNRLNLADPVRELLRSADYRIEGNITPDGRFRGALNGRNYDINLFGNNSDLTYDQIGDAPCGGFAIRLYVVERTNRRAPLYQLLTKDPVYYQGMLVYRDGFRVLPYGNAGVDWLGFDRRRIKKVGRHISNSQMLGFVSITAKGNPLLKDKTNREGMIENRAYQTFQQLLISLVNWVEAERHNRLTAEKQAKPAKPIAEHVQRILGIPSLPVQAVEQVKTLHHVFETEVKERDRRLAAMFELAGVGLAAERMTHELGFLLRGIRSTLEAMNDEGCTELAAELGRYVTELEREIKYLEPLYQAGRRKSEVMSVADVVRHAFFLFSRDFRKHKISAGITSDSTDFQYKGNKGMLLQVLINVLDNAVFWLQKEPPDSRRILIKISADAKTLLIADSGPGIPHQNRDSIFEPFFSTRGGRGLGLYIVRKTLEESGHSFGLVQDSTDALLHGAVFRLTLSGTEE